MFVFDGGTSTVQPHDYVLPADELCDVAFVRPGDLGSHLPPVMVARLAAAMEACRTGAIAYLER